MLESAHPAGAQLNISIFRFDKFPFGQFFSRFFFYFEISFDASLLFGIMNNVLGQTNDECEIV